MPSDDAEEALLLSTVERSRVSMVGQYGRTCRQELIVVASLIDKIPNLAGLARTCEVFQASSLVVAQASVVNDPEFQNISVTAEKWIPIMEVPEAGLEAYLLGKRADGWSLVGLEQTTTSVEITKFEFPKKTVLLLGREKEGVPVELIQMLDHCVEIPQLGMIRSLNVHVSAAIAAYQYTKQMRVGTV
jgi:tRNA G18 (ribose-2'-O)-methylase SpoU